MKTDKTKQPVSRAVTAEKEADARSVVRNTIIANLALKDLASIEYGEDVAAKSGIRKYIPDTRMMTALLVLLILSAASFAVLNYRPRPSTERKSAQLAGVNIDNKDLLSARQQLAITAATQKINIVVDGTAYTYEAADLGIKRDISSLLDATYAPPRALIDKLTTKREEKPALGTYIQKKKLISTIQSKLGQYKTTENASVSVDGGILVVNQSKTGIDIDFDQIEKQLEQSDLRGNLTITASIIKQEPAIPTAVAEKAKADAEGLISPAYGVATDIKGGKLATPAQKAGWLVFRPNQSAHSIEVSIDAKAAKNTLNQLAQSYTKDAKDRVVLTISDGSTDVLDEGQAGISLDQASLSDGLNQFQTALNTRQAYTLPVKLAIQQPAERNLGTVEGGKFVLVDVPNFKAYAVENASVVRTMLVSTGRASMPTPKGHFKILRKNTLVTMRGCAQPVGCWVVPDVPNAEFFTGNGDALHGTYWHNQFGKANLSHGCVNLSLDDAAWLYGWTEVGTDVVVV